MASDLQMNDKTLLQLAAKAAGIEIYTQIGNTILYPIGKYLGHWNPLTSNDDALRLAVKLRMEIDIAENWVAVRHYKGIKTLVERTINEDNCTVTRRAIVRCAAEIGKAA